MFIIYSLCGSSWESSSWNALSKHEHNKLSGDFGIGKKQDFILHFNILFSILLPQSSHDRMVKTKLANVTQQWWR